MAEIKSLIRILNTDIEGTTPIYKALTKVKGISFVFSNAMCNILNLDKKKEAGSLTEKELADIETLAKSPSTKMPSWLLNRRKDVDTGVDKHLTGGDIKFVVENDIKMMKKIKCYKGMRHAIGLPVRGQRTRGNFRSGKAIGVTKKAVGQSAPSKEDQKKKDKG